MKNIIRELNRHNITIMLTERRTLKVESAQPLSDEQRGLIAANKDGLQQYLAAERERTGSPEIRLTPPRAVVDGEHISFGGVSCVFRTKAAAVEYARLLSGGVDPSLAFDQACNYEDELQALERMVQDSVGVALSST